MEKALILQVYAHLLNKRNIRKKYIRIKGGENHLDLI